MSINDHRRHYAIESSRHWLGIAPPRFLLRLRLRLVRHEIARVELQLADEFATLDTMHLIAELEALTRERDALIKRLCGAR